MMIGPLDEIRNHCLIVALRLPCLDSDLIDNFQDTWTHGNLVLVRLGYFRVFENWAIFFQILYRRFFEYLDMGYRRVFRVFGYGISCRRSILDFFL
ncbi:unnamed protein product [Rhizophagus irregularis]|nr:unnamed protein product [Rhizophagus irregularis]